MEEILKNIADFAGDYDSEPIVFSSNEVSTVIVKGVTATKSANKTYWVNGPLTYTIVVSNESGMELSNVILTDLLDSALVTLNSSYGVKVDGVTAAYTFLSGTLTVHLPAIEDGGEVTVTFQVMQV